VSSVWTGAGESRALWALVALGVNLSLGSFAWWRGWVNRSGWMGGVVLGTWILFFGRWPAYAVLVGFFLLGTGATRLGYRRKAREGLAQEEQGRRGARHAVANCGVGLLLVSLFPRIGSTALAVAYVAAFATAVADTMGSEVGQLWGRSTFDPLRLRRVERGMEGAVSVEGTLAGVAGASILAFLGALAGLYPLSMVLAVVVGAVLGSWLESLTGSLLRGRRAVNNEILNFGNTAVGALLAWMVARLAF